MLAEATSALHRPSAGAFDPAGLEGVPEPIRRYLHAAIAPGTPLARTARLRMRGRIRLGGWMPFRAEQVLTPDRGLLWSARVAGVITGFDRYVDGAGSMSWTLAGMVPLVRAVGADITCSTAGRLAGEAIWLPTALVPGCATRCAVRSPTEIVVTHDVDAVRTEVTYRLDRAGRPTSLVLDRWGDPDGTGSGAWHRFGGDLADHRRFGGLTIPTTGRVGWHYGTDRWPAGEFFRFWITDLQALV